MPDFSTEIEIDAWDYISSCSNTEVEHLITVLVEDGHLDSFNNKVVSKKKITSLMDDEWKEGLNKLFFSRHLLSSEDEQIIFDISKRLV